MNRSPAYFLGVERYCLGRTKGLEEWWKVALVRMVGLSLGTSLVLFRAKPPVFSMVVGSSVYMFFVLVPVYGCYVFLFVIHQRYNHNLLFTYLPSDV